MTIASLDNADLIRARALKALRAEFGDEAVKEMGGKLGDSLILKFEIKFGSKEDQLAIARESWTLCCNMIHPELTPTHFGVRFLFRGQGFTINSISPNKPKFAIGAVRDDGKQFGFPAEMAVKLCAGAIARQAVAPDVSKPPRKRIPSEA